MKTAIINELSKTKATLLDHFQHISTEQFNTIPFEGSWTAGQVAEHIFKFVSGTSDLLHGPSADTDRDPLEKMGTLKTTFLDFNVRYQAPDFVVPGNTPVAKDAMLGKLGRLFDDIETFITNSDLAPTCTAFDLPVIGALTRAEWIWFAIFHTQRHIHQLGNIELALEKKVRGIAVDNH